MMKRLLFSAFIMLFAGGLFAQVNFVSADVAPQVHADKVIKEIQTDLGLTESQIQDIRSVTMDATAAIQRAANLKTTNPAQYKEQHDNLVMKVDAKIYSILAPGRQQEAFKNMIARPINTDVRK